MIRWIIGPPSADRIALEALALGLVALDVRQAGDAVPLEAAVQR